MQALLKGENPVDWLVISLSDGTTKSIYFDVSEYFGKG
jgi:VCBS repeat-containing protein